MMIQPVYNYFVSNYMPKPQAANRTHKPSELRNLYNNMLKLNQKMPLYKLSISDDTQLFALSLKETAMELNQFMSDMDTAFSYQKAVSENPVSAEASIVGNSDAPLPEGFLLDVHSLASPQVNTGAFVSSVNRSRSPYEGSYSFTIEQEDSVYEFQVNIKEYSRNQDILTKLSNFINKSKVGVKASVLQENNTVALRLESKDTGDTGEPIFRIKDTSSPKGVPGLAEFYRLDTTTSKPTNAFYSIDGEEHSGLTNRFILGRSLQIDLKEPSEEAFAIDYAPDTEKIVSQMEHFKNSFNYMIDLARNFGAKQPTANRVVTELKAALRSYLPELESVGFSLARDGHLSMDTSLAATAIDSHELQGLFNKESGPIHDLISKTNYIAIDPMNYVDKVLITYPNIAKPAAPHPYASSIYSGLLFNYYC